LIFSRLSFQPRGEASVELLAIDVREGRRVSRWVPDTEDGDDMGENVVHINLLLAKRSAKIADNFLFKF
jgi:hypothetical protein